MEKKEIPQSNISLLQEIEDLKEKIAELQRNENNQIRQIYRDVEEYFYMVSHELRAPLREIDLYAAFIEEDSGDFMLPQSREDLRSIRQTSSSAMEMIKLFMKYSVTNNTVLNSEVIRLNALISECFASLTKMLPDRKVSIDVERLPNMIGDRFLLKQMIFNILSNSIKFTQNVENAQIKVYVHEGEQTMDYCFEDNGIGFDMKYASKIFDIFERAHGDTDYDGYGIGLAMVKKIAERLDGSVEIFGRENKGCIVTVKFPKEIIIPLKREIQISNDKKNKITIGVLGAYTGSYSGIAPCRKHAYELAVEEINASGGILGKQVQLKFKNFDSDVSQVAKMTWELTEIERVDVLMGGQLSSAREEIRKVVSKAKIPYFFNALYEGGVADHYTFCISAVPEQNMYPMLDYLFERYGKKCYIIAADYNYGVLTGECAKDYIEKKGGVVSGVEYFSVSKSDFDVTIENIRNVKPDILISFCVSKSQNSFYRRWYERGMKIPVVSSIGIGLSYLHKLNEPPIMNQTYFMSSYVEELTTPSAREFTQKLHTKYSRNEVPYVEFDAETAYSSVYLYKKAVEMAGTTETEAVISALESGSISFDGPGGLVTVRGEDHHVIRDEILFRINEKHQIECIRKYPALYSNFIENAIYQETGTSGGLKACGINAPGVQYNMMFRRIL